MIKGIQARVEAGQLTPEKGQEMIEAFKRSLKERKISVDKQAVQRKEYVAGMIKRIQAEVDAGRITPEEGKQRIAALKKGQSQQVRRKKSDKK